MATMERTGAQPRFRNFAGLVPLLTGLFLVVIANTPHVLDPRPTYTASDVRVLAWKGAITPADDEIRNASPENQRAFENTEDFFL